MKHFITKLTELIRKDTTSESESVKLVVVMRVMEIIVSVYALTNMIYSLSVKFYDSFVVFAIIFATYVLLLIGSYHLKRVVQIVLLHVIGTLSVAGGFFCFGSNTCIQNFFIVMVVLCFFTGYGYYGYKLVYTVVIFILYLIFQVNGPNIIPIVPITLGIQHFLQGMNIFFPFVCVSVICYVYSRDSQSLEGKLLEYNNMLKKQASTDVLTGLNNRRSAVDFINKLIDKNSEENFCVCMCDIDFFKKVNDSYGHDIGDVVLSTVARTMVEGFPKDCMISRWGGEEFLVIFPGMNGDDAKMLLDIMRSKIKKLEFKAGEKVFSITITYGLAEYGFNDDGSALIKEADKKLYYGKENGRDQVVY